MKKIFSLFMSATLICTLFINICSKKIFASSEIIADGVYGNNITWILDSDGTLRISGTGEIYGSYDNSYWNEYICNIKTVVIDNGIKSLGDYAFSGFINMVSVLIPYSVVSIGTGVFYNCINLLDIVIPDSVASIGDGAFENCTSLRNIDISEGVTSIGRAVFRGCVSLSSITIPGSVETLGDNLFVECRSLTNVIIKAKITSISEQAFYNCVSLTNIIIPDGVTYIGQNVFYGCCSLSSIVFPFSLKIIDGFAFKDCINLVNIFIPDSVEVISYGSFSSCYALKNIYYFGTEDKWEDIEIIDTLNEYFLNANRIYLNMQKSESVVLIAPFDVISDKTIFYADPVDLENMNVSKAVQKNDATAYHLYFELNGEEMKPNGEVTYIIPVPEKIVGKGCFAMMLNDNGNAENINATCENGYMIFNANQNGTYIIAEVDFNLWFDLNGDEKFNTKDIVRLMKYISFEGNGIEVSTSTDINGDGVTNSKDIVCLMKNIADFE